MNTGVTYRRPTTREIELAKTIGQHNPDRPLARCVYCKKAVVEDAELVALNDGIARGAHESCAKSNGAVLQ